MNNILASLLLIAGFILAVFFRLEGESADIKTFNTVALVSGCAMMMGAIVWKLKDR